MAALTRLAFYNVTRPAGIRRHTCAGGRTDLVVDAVLHVNPNALALAPFHRNRDGAPLPIPAGRCWPAPVALWPVAVAAGLVAGAQ
jgi:hypothetical protein